MFLFLYAIALVSIDFEFGVQSDMEKENAPQLPIYEGCPDKYVHDKFVYNAKPYHYFQISDAKVEWHNYFKIYRFPFLMCANTGR